MNTHQLVLLTALAIVAAVAGYRADKNGWIMVAWIPALIVRIIWVLNLAVIALAWSAQQPLPTSTFITCYFLTAAYLPWWCGIATSALVNKK